MGASSKADLRLYRPVPALHRARTPRAVRVLARVFVLFFLALPFLLLLVPWQQTIRGRGRVAAYTPVDRQQSVDSPIDGRVTEWFVREGSEVKRGDPILRVVDNDPQLVQRLTQQRAAAVLKEEAAQAKISLYEAQVEALQESQELTVLAAGDRVSMSQDRVVAAERAVDAAEAHLVTANLNLDRLTRLEGRGLVSRRDFELATLDVRKAEAELERAQASLRASESERRAMETERENLRAMFATRLASARAERESAASEAASAHQSVLDADVKLARQQTQDITAPCDGTVLRLVQNQGGGGVVKAGDSVAVIVPDTESLAVELWVDGNDMPLITVGRKVRLQFEGWPAVQFAGWPSVAVGTFGGVVSLIDAADDGTGRFRVLVLPDPDDPPWPQRRYLRQGVQAKGWVLLEQVRLGFELWRQINGFPPVVTPDPDPTSDKPGKTGK